jgi:hypothetical protein
VSKTITNFLVGLGFDYDKKGATDIGSGIDSIKSKALQLGSVVAGAFGIKALTADFAASKDMLGKFSEVFNVSANDVQAFGNALATEGGSLESFMAQLESIERARARIKVGDVSFFAPAGKAGLDPNAIADARTATDAYLGLADSFAKMNTQQRINAAEALGLDEASIRLLSQGRTAVEELVAKYATIRPITKDMTESAAEFNRQWLEINQNVGGVADAISAELVPVINDITKSVNNWFGENQSSKLKSISALAKKAFGGEASPEQLSKDTGIPEWMFTETWIERYKKADADLTQSFYDLFKGGGTDAGAKKRPSADDSYLYIMGDQVQQNRPNQKTKSPPVNVYVGSQTQPDVKPNVSSVQPLPPTTMDVTPNVGTVQPVAPTTMDVKPNVSSVTPIDPTTMNVTPNVDPVQPVSPMTMDIRPKVGDLQPLPSTSMVVNPVVMDIADYMANVPMRDAVQQPGVIDPVNQVSSRQSETKQSTTVNVNAALVLDGAVIDRHVFKIVDGMAKTAMEDLISSTVG